MIGENVQEIVTCSIRKKGNGPLRFDLVLSDGSLAQSCGVPLADCRRCVTVRLGVGIFLLCAQELHTLRASGSNSRSMN